MGQTSESKYAKIPVPLRGGVSGDQFPTFVAESIYAKIPKSHYGGGGGGGDGQFSKSNPQLKFPFSGGGGEQSTSVMKITLALSRPSTSVRGTTKIQKKVREFRKRKKVGTLILAVLEQELLLQGKLGLKE